MSKLEPPVRKIKSNLATATPILTPQSGTGFPPFQVPSTSNNWADRNGVTLVEHASEYERLLPGVVVIPIPHKQKSPTETGWTKLRPGSVGGLLKASHASNLGAIWGDGYADIDLDCPEAIKLADNFLPPTSHIFGRKSKQKSHRVYKLSSPTPYQKFADIAGDTLLEIRTGPGKQTVLPRSVNPSGESINFDPPCSGIPIPATVNAADLVKAVNRLAVASLLCRHYPASGSRHDFTLALAGALVKSGVTPAETTNFCKAIWEAADDSDPVDRQKAVESTVSRSGQDIAGWSALTEIVGESVVSVAKKWLAVQDRSPAAVKKAPIKRWQPFPIEIFPPVVQRFIRVGFDKMNCDPALFAVPLLSAFGSAIGTTRTIQLRDDFIEKPIIWAAAILGSGSKKTEAAKKALSAVWARQSALIEKYHLDRDQYENDLKIYKEKKNTTSADKPQPPQYPHVVVSDFTMEGLANCLSQSPRGLLGHIDELAGLFGGMGEYKNGAGGKDTARLLELHSGKSPLKIDRKNSECPVIFVLNPHVSIYGTIQPGIWQTYMTDRVLASGLCARFLWIMPPALTGSWKDLPPDPESHDGIDRVFRHLYGLTSDSLPMELTPDAKAVWAEFYNRTQKEIHATFNDGLKAAFSKLEAYCARFALILQLVTDAAMLPNGQQPLVPAPTINADAITKAVALAEWWKYEIERVHEALHQGATDPRSSLIEWIRGEGGAITSRDLRDHGRQYRKGDAAKKALEELVAAGFGTWKYGPPSRNGGRPSPIFELNKEKVMEDAEL